MTLTLTHKDLCDAGFGQDDPTIHEDYKGSCNAQAYVRFVIPVKCFLCDGKGWFEDISAPLWRAECQFCDNGISDFSSLLFCNHHAKKHYKRLLTIAAEIIDESYRLELKPFDPEPADDEDECDDGCHCLDDWDDDDDWDDNDE